MFLASFEYLNLKYMTQDEVKAYCEIKEYWWTQITTTTQPKERVVITPNREVLKLLKNSVAAGGGGLDGRTVPTGRSAGPVSIHTACHNKWILELHKYMHHIRHVRSWFTRTMGPSTNWYRDLILNSMDTPSTPMAPQLVICQNPCSAASAEAAGPDPH